MIFLSKLLFIQIAVIFKNLMQRLGFEKFYVQGGDWGSVIASDMAVLFPEKLVTTITHKTLRKFNIIFFQDNWST